MKLFMAGLFIAVQFITLANQLPVSGEAPIPVSLEDFEPTDKWKEYANYQGIKVEYRLSLCGDGQKMREQNLLLFRFTNTTNEEKTIQWRTKMWRDGKCFNCERIMRDEYAHSLTLSAGEVIQGECSVETIRDQTLYIHDNYVKYVPGMAKTRLTNFEFVDVTVR